MKLSTYLAAAVVCISACRPALAADSLSAEWARDWSARKLEAIMQLYAPKPVFLPAVGPRWNGTEAIRKNFSALVTAYIPHIVVRSIDSARSGDLGYDSGTYEETIKAVRGGRSIHARGNYLFVFQRQRSGDWKILEQTWTDLEQPPRL